MKTTWSKFELLVTCFSVVMIPLAAWSAAICFTLTGSNTAIPSFVALFLVPLICTAILVRFLKRHGKRIWPATSVITVLLALLILSLKNHVAFAKLIHQITGYYNLEASYFFALFMLLICCGTLSGIGIGSLLSRYETRNL